jgi:ligand-binding sensor domain-containing protein
MNRKLTLICLIFVLLLNFSCVEKQSTEQERNKMEAASSSKTDTLKFTSGISVVFQDSKGNYWFGSRREGISRYDGNAFEYFTTREGLSDNQIRSIQEDKNGVLWFRTQNGIDSYDGKTIKNNAITETGVLQNVWTKTESDLWFDAGIKQGIYKYDGQKLNFLAFPNPKNLNSGNLYAVTSLSKGKNDMLWIGTYAGVFGYNGNQLTVINDELLGFTEKEDYTLHVRSIFEDSKGRLWIGNNGIGVLLKKDDAFINFSKEQGRLMPMNEFRWNTKNKEFTKNTGLQSVFAIQEDSAGNIWFGDRDTGAWKYDGKVLTNSQYLRRPKQKFTFWNGGRWRL